MRAIPRRPAGKRRRPEGSLQAGVRGERRGDHHPAAGVGHPAFHGRTETEFRRRQRVESTGREPRRAGPPCTEPHFPMAEGQTARRLNDVELEKAADDLGKSVDHFKHELDESLKKDKAVDQATRQAALRQVDELKRSAEKLESVLDDNRPASGKRRRCSISPRKCSRREPATRCLRARGRPGDRCSATSKRSHWRSDCLRSRREPAPSTAQKGAMARCGRQGRRSWSQWAASPCSRRA